MSSFVNGRTLEPGRCVEWLVTDSNLSFVRNPAEWTGTRIRFELTESETGSRITFTHFGLAAPLECFTDCSRAWTEYLESLVSLIDSGKGHPYSKSVETKTN